MLQKVEVQRSDYLHRKVAKGRRYLYFRFPPKLKLKPISLPVDEASAEFRRQYDACHSTLRKIEADVNRTSPSTPSRPTRSDFLGGTVAKAIEMYRASKAFKNLKEKSQRIYIGVLDNLKEKIGDQPLRQLDRDAVEEFVNDRYNESGAASMSDLYLTMISNLWKEVRGDAQFGVRKLSNPTIEIERKHKERDGQPHLIWGEDVQDTFDNTAAANLVLARQVLHFTTQRGGDAVRLKWIDYDGKGIKVRPEKTTGKGKVLEPTYHLLPDPLLRALNVAKEITRSDYVLVNQWGNRWSTSATLSAAIRKHLVKIGVRAKLQKRGLSMHGLRHTGASEIAMLPGVGVKGIMSQTGHKSAKLAMHYSEQAEKVKINAMTIEAWNAELKRKGAEKKSRRGLRVVK